MKELIIRCLTGVAFVAILVGGIMYGPATFALLFAVITGMAVWGCEVSRDRQLGTAAGVDRRVE